MAVNIKDLYGNSGIKIPEDKYSLQFSIKYTFLYLLCLLLAMWLFSQSIARVLSRIYRLGEESRVAEDHELSRGFIFEMKMP